MLSRGKFLDNLRRSLVPLAMTTLLVIAGCSRRSRAWTLWILWILVVPPLAPPSPTSHQPPDLPLSRASAPGTRGTINNFARVPMSLACLPYEAWFSVDSILRTLWRLLVSRRRLLQWAPSSEV